MQMLEEPVGSCTRIRLGQVAVGAMTVQSVVLVAVLILGSWHGLGAFVLGAVTGFSLAATITVWGAIFEQWRKPRARLRIVP